MEGRLCPNPVRLDQQQEACLYVACLGNCRRLRQDLPIPAVPAPVADFPSATAASPLSSGGPSAALQFGHEIRKEFVRTHQRSDAASAAAPNFTTRALYLAERTGNAAEPNTLLYCDARVTMELTCKAEDVATPWHDENVVNARNDGISTPEFLLRKRIIHPGEVNKIRTILPGVVVTHTDSPELYVWDFGRQDSRGHDESKHKTSEPNCTLVGHTRNAEYAMSVFTQPGDPPESWVTSGGADCSVLVWRLQDYQSRGKKIDPYVSLMPARRGGNQAAGHTATVEDVSFCGKDRNLLSSVGRDSSLLIWDVRKGDGAVSAVLSAHVGDINAVDFGGVNGHLILTGGSDKHVRVWDSRKLVDTSGAGVPVGDYVEHTEQVNSVMWNQYVPNVFASCADDGQVLVWNSSLTKRPGAANVSACPELLFRHVGHKLQRERAAVIDFQWLPDEGDPWCIATISEMIGGEAGGSTLQIWRMSSMIYSPRDAVAAQLRSLQSSGAP